MDDVTASLRSASKARERLTDAAIELWNVRLDALRQAGDVQGILDQLTQPLESGCDNCSCNQGCNSCLQGVDLRSTDLMR